ncbi:MAG: glycosyltransferase family 2 protein [Bacteroidia bacterium]
MHLPKVAVVIIHWNNKHLLEKFLPSVLASTYKNLEIVVADNNSSDDSVEWLKKIYPQLTVLALPQNYGYAGGYNNALPQIKADYFVLLNNDVEVTPGWIEPVIDALENTPKAVAAQPKILQYNKRNFFEYAGAAGGYIDMLGYAFCKGRLFEYLEEDNGQYDDIFECFWASGACLFIKRQAFFEAGGFDIDFFAHMEEIDLCWRIQLLNYKVIAVNKSVVYHLGGSTLQKASPQKTFLNFKNNLVMLLKNLPICTLIWLLPLRSFLDLLSSIFFLINGMPKHSWAVHRAHAQFFFKFGKWYGMRSKTNKKPFKKLTGTYKGSIVFEHFIGGKKQIDHLS